MQCWTLNYTRLVFIMDSCFIGWLPQQCCRKAFTSNNSHFLNRTVFFFLFSPIVYFRVLGPFGPALANSLSLSCSMAVRSETTSRRLHNADNHPHTLQFCLSFLSFPVLCDVDACCHTFLDIVSFILCTVVFGFLNSTLVFYTLLLWCLPFAAPLCLSVPRH